MIQCLKAFRCFEGFYLAYIQAPKNMFFEHTGIFTGVSFMLLKMFKNNYIVN